MGSSISKSKGSSSQQNTNNNTFSCSTTSSERTMVEQQKQESNTTNNSKRASFFGSSNKPSILPNNNFFNNILNKNNNKSTKKSNSNKQGKTLPKHTVTSLAKRRKPRYNNASNNNNNKRKKVAIVVTKSIIGKPTNFKHVNSSTTQFNHMQFLQDDEDEAAKVATQMALLSSLMKPLPNNNTTIDEKIPIIPARSSSYGNAIYIKEFSIPSSTTSMATPSIKKTRKKVTGMKNNNSSLPRTSIPRKRAQYHVKSVKKVAAC